MKKNNNLNKEIIHNYEYKKNLYITLTEKTCRYEIGNRLININDDLIFTKSPIFNSSLSYPNINNQIQINFTPLKIIEILQCSFFYKNHQYMFILETHYTLDNKPLFKTIKIITKDNLIITNKINDCIDCPDFKEILFIIKRRSDFPTDHHYNPKFFTKQWAINKSKPNDCRTIILKKFFNKKEYKNSINPVKKIFSKDHLYSTFTSNSLSTLEKGFIQESERLLQILIKKYKDDKIKTTFLEKDSIDYITILILFLRIHFKSDKVAVDNFFHTLDSVCNDYSTFENFCKKHIIKSVENMIKELFNKDFYVAIFKTNNPIGFFLNEQWKITGTNEQSTEIDYIVIPLSPEKAIIFSHEKDYIKKFDDKFEKFQKNYLYNSLHDILYSEYPLSLIYKNNNDNVAENFIKKTLNEPYPEYLNLPDEYREIPVIEIWTNNKYDLNLILEKIKNSNNKIEYFKN